MKRVLLLIFLVISFFGISQCVTISDGTYGNSQTSPYAPIYGLNDYGRSASIYYASDIGSSKTITSIAWYVDAFQSGYSQTGPYTFNNVKIYFGYTTLSGWSNINNVSGVDMISGVNVSQGITSWTKVFDGSITFNASDTWKSINLDSPYSYNGTSNLIVQVENWDGSWSYGYPIFHYTSTSSSSLRTMKYYYSDGSMPSTSTDASRSYNRPDIQFCEASSLPIELLYFKPYLEDGIVKFKWATASEQNNDYFTIEKSLDGINFNVITNLPGAGNSSTMTNYTSVDRNPSIGISYYRLKQTDYDGRFKRTDWYSVNIESDINGLIIYPNPIGNKINIECNSFLDKNEDLLIFDITGKIIFKEIVNLRQGDNSIVVDLPDFLPGIYLAKLGTSQIKITK